MVSSAKSRKKRIQTWVSSHKKLPRHNQKLYKISKSYHQKNLLVKLMLSRGYLNYYNNSNITKLTRVTLLKSNLRKKIVQERYPLKYQLHSPRMKVKLIQNFWGQGVLLLLQTFWIQMNLPMTPSWMNIKLNSLAREGLVFSKTHYFSQTVFS